MCSTKSEKSGEREQLAFSLSRVAVKLNGYAHMSTHHFHPGVIQTCNEFIEHLEIRKFIV